MFRCLKVRFGIDQVGGFFRFLKARRFDHDKTVHMWEEMLKWRRENGVDTIMQVKNLSTWVFLFSLAVLLLTVKSNHPSIFRILCMRSTKKYNSTIHMATMV